MKAAFATLILFVSTVSSAAQTACEAGRWTTLASPVEFIRKEDGKVLKVEMPAGSEVHIVIMNSELIGLYTSTEFQGQEMSLTAGGPADDVLKVLRCSASAN